MRPGTRVGGAGEGWGISRVGTPRRPAGAGSVEETASVVEAARVVISSMWLWRFGEGTALRPAGDLASSVLMRRGAISALGVRRCARFVGLRGFCGEGG